MDGMRWIKRNHTSPSALSSALTSFLLFAEVNQWKTTRGLDLP